jgi:kynureninase
LLPLNITITVQHAFDELNISPNVPLEWQLFREAESLALVMLPGVQYYTGQKLDMELITRYRSPVLHGPKA